MAGSEIPKARWGIIDLRHWDFHTQGLVKMDGMWEFYWKQLLIQRDFPGAQKHDAQYIRVPGIWNTQYLQSTEKKIPSDGYATYRLRVLLPDRKMDLGLRIMNVATAFRLYVDNQLLAVSGKVGKSRKSSLAKSIPQLVVFSHKGNLDLIFQVSNFESLYGGIWTSLWIGNYKEIIRARNWSLMSEMFLFGSLLIIGLYHVGFYVMRRKERSFLAFGLLCLDFALRITVQDEHIFQMVFPHLDWQNYTRIAYLTYYLALPLTACFIYANYPKDFSKRILYFICGSTVFFVGSVLLFEQKVYEHLIIIEHIITVLLAFYIMYTLVRGILHKQRGSLIIFLGFILLFMTTINDMLLNSNIIFTINLVPLGLYIFVLCQAFVLSWKFSNAFDEAEKLSVNLNHLLREREKDQEILEQKVEERTSDLRGAVQMANQANKAKTEFLANISHELRTPLNGILGFAEILSQQRKEPEGKSFARKIIFESERLLNLINQLLDISKIESNKMWLEKKGFNLKNVVDAVFHIMELSMEEKGLERRIAIDDDVPVHLKGDGFRLHQVLINLLGNAIKFTEKGFVKLEIKVETLDQNSITLLFKIIDSGVGIPQERLGTIFDSFVQGDASITREFGGSGLGTTIAQRLVRMMGGDIQVHSVVGQGTTFWFTACFEEDTYILKEEVMEKKSETYIKSYRGERVLLVEDYEINQDVIRTHLESIGLAVDVADNGLKALEKLKEKSYELVIMDVQMPVMDGYSATRYIRERMNNKGLIILGMTANAFDEDIQKCLKAGMNTVVTKPVTRNRFLQMVTQCLEGKWSLEQPLVEEPKGMDKVIFHYEAFLAEFDGDKETTHDILIHFLHRLDQDLPKMEEVLEKGDLESLQRMAHAIKGGALEIMADGLSAAAAALEQGCKDDNGAMAPGLMLKVKEESEILENYINRLL